MSIVPGVKQECVLSLTLFNFYLIKIMTKALGEASDTVSVNRQLVDNFRYPDNTALIPLLSKQHQRLLDKVYVASATLYININAKKS